MCLSLIRVLCALCVDPAASVSSWAENPGGEDPEDLCHVFRDRGVFDESAGDGGVCSSRDGVRLLTRLRRTSVGETDTGRTCYKEQTPNVSRVGLVIGGQVLHVYCLQIGLVIRCHVIVFTDRTCYRKLCPIRTCYRGPNPDFYCLHVGLFITVQF